MCSLVLILIPSWYKLGCITANTCACPYQTAHMVYLLVISQSTVDSCYLEVQGTLKYCEISIPQYIRFVKKMEKAHFIICNLTPEVRDTLKILLKRGEKLFLPPFPQDFDRPLKKTGGDFRYLSWKFFWKISEKSEAHPWGFWQNIRNSWVRN